MGADFRSLPDFGSLAPWVLGYLARGRRDLAAQQVARWRAALDELHLEPSEEARALWRTVE